MQVWASTKRLVSKTPIRPLSVVAHVPWRALRASQLAYCNCAITRPLPHTPSPNCACPEFWGFTVGIAPLSLSQIWRGRAALLQSWPKLRGECPIRMPRALGLHKGSRVLLRSRHARCAPVPSHADSYSWGWSTTIDLIRKLATNESSRTYTSYLMPYDTRSPRLGC